LKGDKTTDDNALQERNPTTGKISKSSPAAAARARAGKAEKERKCARPLASNGHGPVVVHLVTSRYKLYYEDATAGRDEKPLRLIYADGARTGEGAFAGSTTANRAVHRLAMVWLH